MMLWWNSWKKRWSEMSDVSPHHKTMCALADPTILPFKISIYALLLYYENYVTIYKWYFIQISYIGQSHVTSHPRLAKIEHKNVHLNIIVSHLIKLWIWNLSSKYSFNVKVIFAMTCSRMIHTKVYPSFPTSDFILPSVFWKISKLKKYV